MQRNDFEIMSPVGSFDSLMAAIQGNADAVYFGAGNLNMRSRSSANFSNDDIKEIVKICNNNGLKSYLTLNVVLYDENLDEMRRMVDIAQESGISAIIASDQSAILYARKQNVNVHISTQINISNIETLKFYAQYADVVVLARELNLNQVKYIHEIIINQNIKGPNGELIRIEMFAHGALCMAVSGKCYLSLHQFNHSANRGACFQPCRRGYLVSDIETGNELIIDNQYIMSPKDLKTISFLNKMIDAGVRVFKIEGRARGPEYVKTVTKCYDEAINAILNNDYTEERISEWNQKLATVFNRGFWDGYYLGQPLGEWSSVYGSEATKRKVYIGKNTNFFPRISVGEFILETDNLKKDDDILITGPTTGALELKVNELRLDLQPVDEVKKGDKFSMPVNEKVRRGDKLFKFVNTLLLFLFAIVLFNRLDAQQPNVFFYEDCGETAPSTNPRPSPSEYTGWLNYGVDNIAFSGNSDVRSTYYDNSHVWFAAATYSNPTRTLQISGINTSDFDDIKLSFRIANAGNSTVNIDNYFTVTCFDENNVTYNINLPTITTVYNQWSIVTNLPGIPTTENLTILFTSFQNNDNGFRLDDISLTATNIIETFFDFKITTWNVEWLSCLSQEPLDRELQINNVVSVINTMNSDFVALQEVGTSNLYTTIDTLVHRLGSNVWAGNIVPWHANNCSQNQGIVYKKEKLQLINSALITNGGTSYNWSNGRFPALYNLNFIFDDENIPVSFINIHAKAFATETDWERRQNASIGLKNLLDGPQYYNNRVIIIGDFNDYLEGTICTTCGNISPYKNFMDDVDNYKAITLGLMHPYYNNPIIDNIIITNELFDNYLLDSELIEVAATQTIPNYYYTTSTHYPVSATLRMYKEVSITNPTTNFFVDIFPNPTSNITYVITSDGTPPLLKLFSIDGRLLQTVQSNEIDMSAYASGIYFIMINNEARKLIKQ